MNMEKELYERSGAACELCGSKDGLKVYEVPAVATKVDNSILICDTCFKLISDVKGKDANHWRCLNNSMWSTVPAVQVMVWRLLNTHRDEGWPQDLLDMLYLDDETLAWAKYKVRDDDDDSGKKVLHKDSNGTVLQAGDTVILTKDLDVKGGGFTAKRGTAVRSITLVENNPDQIEGKVNGQQIVILTQYVKRSSV
jgi:protein PhnA